MLQAVVSVHDIVMKGSNMPVLLLFHITLPNIIEIGLGAKKL